MAMLASKSSYSVPHSATSQPSSAPYSDMPSYRRQPSSSREHNGFFASPTESEFSEYIDGAFDPIRDWDEDTVAEWLRGIEGCAQYVPMFKQNNINGENLMEMDSSLLKDMGIKKMGHRLRISTEVKKLRNKQHKKTQQQSNRDSLAMLDNFASWAPPPASSPGSLPQSSRANKRMSRMLPGFEQGYAQNIPHHLPPRSSSRPASPFVEPEPPTARSAYSAQRSPKREHYFGLPRSAATTTGRAPRSPAETPQTARFATHVKNASQDSAANSMVLPLNKPLIRVIYPDNARTAVLSVEGCKTAEDVILKTLRKGNLNEAHVKNYCFYILDSNEPNPKMCRRVSDTELVEIINRNGPEKGRLIFRKIHMGEPEEEQLRQSATIANQQKLQQTDQIYPPQATRSQSKIEQLTGESLGAMSYPLSPASAKERERHIDEASQSLERADSARTTSSQRTLQIKELSVRRPPSQLIASDLNTYFPEVGKDKIDRTLALSIRRSNRLSRAASRLSTVSTSSIASNLRDAPSLPSISDPYINPSGQGRTLRPLSIVRLGHSANYRDSMASTLLEPLDEESPLEPNRKSYVSFTEHDPISITDPEGNTTLQSYYDDGGSTAASSLAGSTGSPHGTGISGDGDSLNKRLSQIIQEDSDEDDVELKEYLENDSWENMKYMKGALIGQGSFGSVYLALHAVTGELMAVKQVEMPSSSGTQLDAKKNSMVEALKHEIGLLRDLKHTNIVQYLGSNSDESHLNIFLEYVPGGSVASMLVNYGPLGEGLIGNFVRQILSGLQYLHSRDIIHRDIKGANILVDHQGSVKISDFGISKKVNASTLLNTPTTAGGAGGKPGRAVGPRVSLQGSVFWMAPEVVKQTAYTRKADIWSLGCLIVEMFTGQHPHPNCTQLQAIFKIGGSGDATPTIPEGASEDARSFLNKTFEIDHEKRPTAEELLEMPLCKGKA